MRTAAIPRSCRSSGASGDSASASSCRRAPASRRRLPPTSSPPTTTTAAFWSRSPHVRSRQLAFDPSLELLEGDEGFLQLAQLGVGGSGVGSAKEAERLEPVDGRRRQVVTGTALDLGLAELGADPLCPRR